METIIIEHLEDTHECDTCGISYADGYRATCNGEVIDEFTPVAHCYQPMHIELEDFLIDVMETLGYKVELQ